MYEGVKIPPAGDHLDPREVHELPRLAPGYRPHDKAKLPNRPASFAWAIQLRFRRVADGTGSDLRAGARRRQRRRPDSERHVEIIVKLLANRSMGA
jgi:hypothetical protein